MAGLALNVASESLPLTILLTALPSLYLARTTILFSFGSVGDLLAFKSRNQCGAAGLGTISRVFRWRSLEDTEFHHIITIG